MKSNRNIVLLIILVAVLGIVAFWLLTNRGKGTIKESLKNFAVEDTASITKIFLADKTGKSVLLEKEKPGLWKLNKKFYARNDAINTLLYTMKRVEVRQPVGKKAKANVIKQLSTMAVKMEAYSGDELVKVYYIGGETQDQTGTYMLMVDEETGENSGSPFITYIPGFEGYLTTRYFTTENDWRDRTIFKHIPPQIQSVKVEYPLKSEEGFQIEQPVENKFVLTPLSGSPLTSVDTLAIKQYLSYFQNIQYEGLDDKIPQTKRDSILSSVPFGIFTLKDKEGKTSSIKLFYMPSAKEQYDTAGKVAPHNLDRFYGLLNHVDFVIGQYYVFGKLLQPVTYFASNRKVVKK